MVAETGWSRDKSRQCCMKVLHGTAGETFSVKVGMHQVSVLLFIIIVLETLSREFGSGVPWSYMLKAE